MRLPVYAKNKFLKKAPLLCLIKLLFKKKFFLFLLYFVLQYCIGFAIHWHESAMGVHELWLRKTRKKESSGTSEKLLLLHLCIEDRDSLCRANQIHSSAFWKLLYFSLLERPHMQDDSWLLAAMWGRASS